VAVVVDVAAAAAMVVGRSIIMLKSLLLSSLYQGEPNIFAFFPVEIVFGCTYGGWSVRTHDP
jgi:hypothetical protein